MRSRNTLAMTGLIVLAAFGCEAGSFVAFEDVTDVPIDISVDLAQTAVAGVSVEITGPGIAEPILANLPVVGDSATGTVRVLSGSDRAFLIRAFDAQSVETHRGGATLDIVADVVHSLDVALSPLTGDVDVVATAGNYTVTVSLPADSLAVGQTLQGSATVIDARGDTVQSPQLTWGSSNPSVAQVGGDGLIEGSVPGEAMIGASYEGFAGSAALTVH